MDDILERSRQGAAQARDQRAVDARHVQQISSIQDLEQTLITAIATLIQFLDGNVTKAEVVNQLQSISTPDVVHVVNAIRQLDTTVNGKTVDLSPLVDGLSAIHTELQQIPKELPETKDSITVDNLSALDKHFTTLEKTIRALKLNVEAPKVDVKVPEPKVVVQEANLMPLQGSLNAVIKAIQAIQIPQAEKLDLSPVTKSLSELSDTFEDVLKQLGESDKKLKKLIEKPIGGGGGGGQLPFEDSSGNASLVQLTPDGRLPVAAGNLAPSYYDYISVTQDTDSDTYVYKTGGSGGSVDNTLVITYTDSTKQNIASISKS